MQIPEQYSTKIELPASQNYREVLVCFVPMIRAGCEPDWRWSHMTFIFTRLDGKEERRSFIPVYRWTDEHMKEWHATLELMPAGFQIEHVFEQACTDLVL